MQSPENSDTIKMQTTTKQIWVLIGMIFLCYFLLLPKYFVGLDGENWKQWAHYIFENGLSKSYYNEAISYPPIYIYALYFFTLLFDTSEKLLSHLYLTRVIALAFDFLTVAALWFYVLAIRRQAFLLFFLLLNIAFIYNSLVWWQTDSIHTAFVLLAVFMALYQKPVFVVLFFILAINSKLNALIYSPIIVLLLLPLFKAKPYHFLWALLLGFLFQFIILSPFLVEGNLGNWFHSLIQRIDYYHFASMKAYNFWYLWLDNNPRNVSDSTLIFDIISYKNLGLVLFFIASALALFPLCKKTCQLIKHRTSFQQNDIAFIFLSLGLITLIFFFFPTRIHERFAHAGVLFFFVHACVTSNFRLYFWYAIAYFINLEKEAQFLLLPNEIYDFLRPEYIAVLYAFIGGAAFKELYAMKQNALKISLSKTPV